MKSLLLALLVVVAAVAPAVLHNPYYLNLLTQACIASMFALSLDLLCGHAGLDSLAHGGFLGLSAYTSAWLTMSLGFGHLPAAFMALVVASLGALVFGLIALRAAGIGFLMITLALGQILWGIAYRWASVTGATTA